MPASSRPGSLERLDEGRATHLGAGRGSLRIARLLSLICAVLVAVSAFTGLIVEGVYREPDAVAAMFRAYDLVALAIIAPALVATHLPILRRSVRAMLVWIGLLAYMVYHSAMYLFGTGFNDLFLAHVAVFSLSILAFGLALADLDATAIARHFSDSTPERWIGGILLALAFILAAFWSTPSVLFVVTGELPEEASELIAPIVITRLGWALDLALLVPAYALAGLLLWRRAAWGYLLATAVLIAGVLQQMEYMVALVFQANADIRGATGYDPIEPFIAAIYVTAAVIMLTKVEDGGVAARHAARQETSPS